MISLNHSTVSATAALPAFVSQIHLTDEKGKVAAALFSLDEPNIFAISGSNLILSRHAQAGENYSLTIYATKTGTNISETANFVITATK
jgi:hypothetical protein